jgi:hypothetical protein
VIGVCAMPDGAIANTNSHKPKCRVPVRILIPHSILIAALYSETTLSTIL